MITRSSRLHLTKVWIPSWKAFSASRKFSNNHNNKSSPNRMPSEEEWKAKLSKKEFEVLRNKGTEAPGTGEYDKFYPKEGYFVCRGCGNPLYSASAKFNSGCGWPAFDKCFKGAITTHADNSFFSRRIEIVCSRCGGHQGHVFEGEGMTPTNERHCVNSVSVKYIAEPIPHEVALLGESKVTEQ